LLVLAADMDKFSLGFNIYRLQNIIEVAPLAFMRGRTLNEAFIILDEAQNTTIPQMKMFLTRLGFASKMVITGVVLLVEGRQQMSQPHLKVQQ
jgi:phosphate starvation-inducible protein PhoH